MCTSDWDSRILAKMFRKAVPGEGGFDLDPEKGWDCQGTADVRVHVRAPPVDRQCMAWAVQDLAAFICLLT